MRFVTHKDIGDDAYSFRQFQNKVAAWIWAVLLPCILAGSVWSVQWATAQGKQSVSWLQALAGVGGAVSGALSLMGIFLQLGNGDSPYNQILGLVGRSWVTLLWWFYGRNRGGAKDVNLPLPMELFHEVAGNGGNAWLYGEVRAGA